MRILSILCGVLFIAGCSGSMVGLYETNGPHFIGGTLNEEQVRESILEGAKNAGWKAEYHGNTTILATYQIRIHTVQVSIDYSDQVYIAQYKSSIAMKMYCTDWDRDNRKHIVSGIENCPNARRPVSINANYKIWIDALVAEIQKSLSTK